MIRSLFLTGIALVLFSACTSSRWIIEEEPAVDISESQLIDTRPAFVIRSMPTPERPILTIDGRTIEVYESPLKLEANRVIQRYRPRYGWAAFGILGAGGLFYIANADGFFETDLTRTQKNVLMGSGGLLLAGSMLNMRPVGDPRYTGEKRFLNKVGTDTRMDTTSVAAKPFDVIINAFHDEDEIVSGLQLRVDSTLTLNLISDLGLRSFSPDNPGYIRLDIKSEFEEQEIKFPVQQVLKRYVRIVSRNIPLRSSPQISPTNIVTTVAEASLLPWVETTDNGWHRVLLGITPMYVQVTDGALIWRPAMSNESDLIITTSNLAFGSIDVERDIPRAEIKNERGIAILIGNQNYRNTALKNAHAHRSVRLMRTYLRESLGYSDDRIIIIEDFRTEENLDNILKTNRADRTLHDLPYSSLTDLFVYYVGAGGVVHNGSMQAGLIPVDGLPGEGIALESFMQALAQLPVRSVRVMIDADFRELPNGGIQSNFRANYAQLSQIVTRQKSDSWVMFASEPSQIIGNYVSNDRRTDRIHGIMTYYFARAIQDGNTDTDMILRYMLRNMTFTSRRLHNRPQDPVFFGNRNSELLFETAP